MTVKTPICDYVREYSDKSPARFHMPGHKGRAFLGCEKLDITEIDGADALISPIGIIAESEKNAGTLFGCRTFYSAEGSSLCIRAMLRLAAGHSGGGRPLVLAARNVHTAFLTAAALIDFDISWLDPRQNESRECCSVSPGDVENAINTAEKKPCAVYLTSPDYLGNEADIKGISAVCRKCGVPLLVDGAHGAYLRFLTPSRHPIDLGADMCCASAHKTLPVLTGGAYLFLGPGAEKYAGDARKALDLFGTTSPSYLILQSLDACNAYLENHRERLAGFLPKVGEMKARLSNAGYELMGTEPLKITINAPAYGYTGVALADSLRERNVFCEYHDKEHLTLMLTPENGDDLYALQKALLEIPKKPPITASPPPFSPPRRVLSVREACFAEKATLPVRECLGRVMAGVTVKCPPAVPTVMCGEEIDEAGIQRLLYYGAEECTVVR